MRIVYERCAGLDVHKKTVVACRVVPDGKVLGNTKRAPLGRCWMTCWAWRIGYGLAK